MMRASEKAQPNACISGVVLAFALQILFEATSYCWPHPRINTPF